MMMRCTDEDDTQITGQYYFSHLTSYANYHRENQLLFLMSIIATKIP